MLACYFEAFHGGEHGDRGRDHAFAVQQGPFR